MSDPVSIQNGVYSINGPDGVVNFTYNGDHYITTVWGSKVDSGGSPLVTTLDTPVYAGSVDLGALYTQLMAVINAQ